MTKVTDPSACSCALDASALPARLDAWRRVTSRATSRTVEADRIVGTYPNEPQLLADLRDLVAAEAECCSFLEFSIEERPDLVVTELRLPAEVPPAMRDLIIDLVGPDREATSAP